VGLLRWQVRLEAGTQMGVMSEGRKTGENQSGLLFVSPRGAGVRAGAVRRCAVSPGVRATVVFASLACAILSFGFIAGCGDKGAGGEKPTLSPTPMSQRDVHEGDKIELASGLSIVVPHLLSGLVVGHQPNAPTELIGLRDKLGQYAVMVESLSPHDLATVRVPALKRALVGRSVDGTVQVRWSSGTSSLRGPFSIVAVVTRLPGRLIGIVELGPLFGRQAAMTPSEAMKQALTLWSRLSVEGVELPKRVGP
jgi:hypothetical protein